MSLPQKNAHMHKDITHCQQLQMVQMISEALWIMTKRHSTQLPPTHCYPIIK